MKKLNLLAVLAINLVLISCAEAQTDGGTTIPKTSVAKDISTSEFKEMITPDVIILDVRTPEEFLEGHLENAVNINLFDSDFETKMTQNLDKSKIVLVYCAAGGRSAKAMSKMKEMGYSEIYNMMGGYNEWSSKGLPTVK